MSCFITFLRHFSTLHLASAFLNTLLPEYQFINIPNNLNIYLPNHPNIRIPVYPNTHLPNYLLDYSRLLRNFEPISANFRCQFSDKDRLSIEKYRQILRRLADRGRHKVEQSTVLLKNVVPVEGTASCVFV